MPITGISRLPEPNSYQCCGLCGCPLSSSKTAKVVSNCRVRMVRISGSTWIMRQQKIELRSDEPWSPPAGPSAESGAGDAGSLAGVGAARPISSAHQEREPTLVQGLSAALARGARKHCARAVNIPAAAWPAARELCPAHVSLRRQWGRRTNNSEPLTTYAVTYVRGCSAFLAAPPPASHAATTPVVEDLDIGLVRERSTERCQESFVIGVNDEQLARHTAITAPRGRLSSAE